MMGVTTDNREIELSQSTIDALKTRLRGPLLLPGDSGYDDSRTVWNAMIDRRPALVARCLGTADVTACVQFAREHGLLLCIKGGGHNIAGLATADGALMLDLSLMRGVWVEPQEQIAHAQGGCLLGDVDRETQLHGLAAVMGFISQTGIAGLTLGGGFGYLTRRYGWTCDTVLGMNLVTADGRLVRASSEENPDLFWGLRGGGGNFGVVTGLDYRLYPVGPEIVGGLVAWPASEAPGVMELFGTLTEQAPPELTLVVLMRMAPPAPWLPPEIHGKPIIAISGCYTGNPKDGEKAVAPIKSYGKPVGDMLVAAALRPDAVAAGCDSAQGPALLLEERVPPPGRARALHPAHGARSPDPIAPLGGNPVPHGWCAQPARSGAHAGGQSGRSVHPQHHSFLDRAGSGRSEHRLGPDRVERHEVVLHRRHLHQLPDSGRGT